MNSKQDKKFKKQDMELTVEYEKATPENSRIIIKLFAEMFRLYLKDRKDSINQREVVISK